MRNKVFNYLMLAVIFLLESCSNSDSSGRVRFPLPSVGLESKNDFIWTTGEFVTDSDADENIPEIAAHVAQDVANCIREFRAQNSNEKSIKVEFTLESVRAINVGKTDFVYGCQAEFELVGKISEDSFKRICSKLDQKLDARLRSFGYRKVQVMKSSIDVDY